MDIATLINFLADHAFASGAMAGLSAGIAACGIYSRQVEKRSTEISKKPLYCALPHQKGLAPPTLTVLQRVNVKTGKRIAIECPFYRKDSFLLLFDRHRCAAMGGETCLHFRHNLSEEEESLIAAPPPPRPQRLNPSPDGWAQRWRR